MSAIACSIACSVNHSKRAPDFYTPSPASAPRTAHRAPADTTLTLTALEAYLAPSSQSVNFNFGTKLA